MHCPAKPFETGNSYVGSGCGLGSRTIGVSWEKETIMHKRGVSVCVDREVVQDSTGIISLA
jgi:hypothetical protein